MDLVESSAKRGRRFGDAGEAPDEPILMLLPAGAARDKPIALSLLCCLLAWWCRRMLGRPALAREVQPGGASRAAAGQHEQRGSVAFHTTSAASDARVSSGTNFGA